VISLLNSEPPASEIQPGTAAEAAGEGVDFEIVVGRRQIASISLVAVVLMVVFSGVFYLIGKSGAPKPPAPTPDPVEQVAQTPAVQASAVQAPQIPVAAAVQPPLQLEPAAVQTNRMALSGEPVRGAVYIQVGAVEKGVAQIWVEGLRTHGLPAFVAAGPSERIFRVLVGPLPNPEAYQQVKGILDRIGLENFGRKYQQ
jgi:hypothetical protein